MKISDILLRAEKTQQILAGLKNNQSVSLRGLYNSRMAFFTANIFPRINNNVLLITPDSYKIEQIYEDLLRLLSAEELLVFPEIEVLPHEQIVPDFIVSSERLRVLQQLLFDEQARIILTSIRALMRMLMPAERFRELALEIKVGEELDRQKFIERLQLLGYERENMVEQYQQFSVRGGIIDIFTLTEDKPYRIELFGDEIESIRIFDPATQRSKQEVDGIIISPAREIVLEPARVNEQLPVIKEDYEETIRYLQNADQREEAGYLKEKSAEILEKLTEFKEFPGYEQFLPYFYDQPDTIFSYLEDKAFLFFDNPDKIRQRIESFNREMHETQVTLLEQGSILPSYSENFLDSAELFQQIKSYNGVSFGNGIQRENQIWTKSREFSYTTRGVEPFHGQLELFAGRVQELIPDYKIVVTLNSDGKVRRIADFLRERDIPAIEESDKVIPGQVLLTAGSLSEGFIIEDIKLALFTDREVMGEPQKRKRQSVIIEEGVEISSLNELNPGDYVVHENHGIGKYMGIKTMEIQNQHQDYLVIEYADQDKLYVPTDQVNLVQKYIGTDGKPPRLYSLGSSEWKKVKQRVKESVKEMAIGLLELYAERETISGYSFSEDTIWQQEFEDSFPYQETPDQLQAIEDVKKDMESSTPMDRLLCGDVGYGKTEVAIRAAFKAAMDEKQTAVLVPTTILAQQHYNTFRERIGDYPINVEIISRFKTRKEQQEILKELGAGKIDIIIGTHRLLSRDVLFSDLGLLVIDEEQRFGVTHKEKLKDIKRNVDVLTLTATPIPRTLHMALVGVRDMSVIETPPENRYPIRTYIREFNRELIAEAIRREMARDGQIYFVHNRVEDIEKKAALIRELVPEAEVAAAHGQMNENKLERLMYNFYNKYYDVLVCTTIIETGLDIPNVNTIIINRADKMGLAQLYQLRGRVGRSNRVAYAYLLYERDRILPEVAEKRLKAIKEFTNLGSGFKIAMRDLEIRGAGNLLGPEQHGHIASIGFSLYCKLLEGAVEELKGQQEERKDIELDFRGDAYIPEEYIPDSRQKIEMYKKIRGARNINDITEIKNELEDRFGTPPQVVKDLIKISEIGIIGRRLGIEKIQEKNEVVSCYFENMDCLEGEAVIELIDNFPGRIKVRSAKKPILSIKNNKSSPLELLEKVLVRLTELLSSN